MPKQMPIYKAEAQAGIADAISATENHVIASLCPLLAEECHITLDFSDLHFLYHTVNAKKSCQYL